MISTKKGPPLSEGCLSRGAAAAAGLLLLTVGVAAEGAWSCASREKSQNTFFENSYIMFIFVEKLELSKIKFQSLLIKFYIEIIIILNE